MSRIGQFVVRQHSAANVRRQDRRIGESPIYHEQQSFWLCAKLQEEAFTHADLERIAKHLHEVQPEQDGWLRINMHRNMLGFGYYDVNVITAALHERGYELLWHNRASGIEEADLDGTTGIIVHTRHNWFFRGSHWFGVKHFDCSLAVPDDAQTHPPGFWNLDSKLARPEYIGSRADLNEFLLKLAKRSRIHVLLVAPSADAAPAAPAAPSLTTPSLSS